MNKTDFSDSPRIAVIGLGYVGLPLALAFSEQYAVVGYDFNRQRIRELQQGRDRTRQVTEPELAAATRLLLTDQLATIATCTVFIITVPTPVDSSKKPDLVPLLTASRSVGSLLKPGDTVVYESTVYPGCTEEDCVPGLENASGLQVNQDFFLGYSPERISPGDKVHTLKTIKKITSGSTPEAAQFIDRLYQSIITAGTHPAPSIRVAEAAKAIENAQRDVNISFVNELALIFDRLGIDTTDVLAAAATKWNFLPFRPGLVGGHCIGVDPYYLTHKAESVGYHPQVLLSGRRINDQMGVFVASKLVKLMIRKGHTINGARVLLLGITYKENCPDIRNSRVIDICTKLMQFGMTVDVYDPWADPDEVAREYGLTVVPEPTGAYDGIVLAVAHDLFQTLDFATLRRSDSVVYDLKAVLPRTLVDGRL